MATRHGPEGEKYIVDQTVNTSVGDVEKYSSSSPPTPSSFIDPKAEARLVRKLDLTIFPIFYVLYTLSFLDRINISNAKIQGMAAELNLTTNKFNIALFIYFVPYILLEVPSNILIRHVRPSWYLGGLMFAWGIINMCMGFVHSYEQLVGLRILLGISEAGVLPGIIFLTSMYYTRHEYQKRISFLFSSTLVGGAFGGLLAYGIANMSGDGHYAAWRWIFIIEGAFTAFVALFAIFIIVDWPETCKYLSAEEKDLVKRRIAADGGDACRMDKLNGYAIKRILTDYKIWLGSFIYMGIGTTGYAITYFMPTVLLEFGWTAQTAQWRTVPVYAVAFVGMLAVAWASDHFRHRYGFILVGVAIAAIGFIMMLDQTGLSRDAKYAAVFLITLGGYSSTPIALAWLANNVSGRWKRSFSSSIQVMLGNIAGIIASNIFLVWESPRYPTGFGTAFGMLWLGTIAATILVVLLWRENKKRNAGELDSRLSHPTEEVENMGDYHPSFRFTL